MISEEIKNKVIEFGKVLKNAGVPVTKLLVFGSYAKNIARADSDIDVCVVSESFGKDDIDEMQFLFKERRKVDTRIEPYPLSVYEYENSFSPIVSEIKAHGIQVA